VIVVGGGVVGAATAFFLARAGAQVTVLERDPAYRRASSALSASSIRQQFSTEINIRLSQASLQFMRRIGDELAVGDERPDIGLVEPGYLLLATAGGAAVLRDNLAVQAACGVDSVLLEPDALARRHPWLALDGIALACLGRSGATSGEGWFDGYSLLQAFRRKALALGARFEAREVTRFATTGARVAAAVDAGGERFEADAVVIAGGAWSAPLAARLGFDLPVRARKRDVFVFTSPARLGGHDGDAAPCPLLVDPSGFWFRPEGRGFICGAPPLDDDADDLPLEPDHRLFEEFLWPQLAARVPAFEALRVTHAWSGYYEYNTFDQNGIVGRLPGCDNAYTACGFSGHGIQQSPAVGRALAELIVEGRYRSLDAAALSPQRIVEGKPLLERNVI
jgi:glycine/D-amino acid oxidase-like deaminating enzyme